MAKVIPHHPRWHQRCVAVGVFSAARLLGSTLRFKVEDAAGLFASQDRSAVIYCAWHNRLVLSLIYHRTRLQRRWPDRRLAAMVSASRDGALLARILELFRVQPVRGSTSRRGPQALLELTTWAERGFDLAITPDGPRGPRYAVQEGVISLAQLTSLPIVPVSFNLPRKIQLGTWDRFQIPLPLGCCEVIHGPPVQVDRTAGEAEREACRRLLEERLREGTHD